MTDTKHCNPSNLRYANKVILAPMVREGTLPLRLLALDYGADLVYCEELIDYKLLRCQRIVNDALGTVDYVDRTDGTIVLRTCERERQKVIMQMGTSDPERAVRVAKLVEKDVSGIDVNMGCPKEFSIKGGMGAALMSNPDCAASILQSLVKSVSIPVTCKVRVFDNVDDSIKLCQRLEATGISAIAVHGRTREERPQHANRNGFLQQIAAAVKIPVIANGGSKEIEQYRDIEHFCKATGCSSVMLARVAQWNCSIFRREGKLPLDQVITEYLKYCVDYDNAPANTKYCVQNMLKELQESPRGKMFLESQTLHQICSLWGLGDYCLRRQEELRQRGLLTRRDVSPSLLAGSQSPLKKPRLSESDMDVSLSCAFLRSCFQTDPELPKTRLLMWTRRGKVAQPEYNTRQHDKLFQSVVTVNGKRYGSTCWEKNKRWAEQSAAIVCLVDLGILEKEPLKKAGCIL